MPQPPQDFPVGGFEVLLPSTGILGCVVCITPQLFLLAYLHTNVGLPALAATALLGRPAAMLPVSTPPTSLDECFFFNSLVVRLSYSSIFWQFWLLFV